MDFKTSVYFYCSKIPKGRVSTYNEIAKAIGKAKASRAVGQALKFNTNPEKVPCYRVVRSDGSLGGYCGSDPLKIKEKEIRLRKDGILVENNRVDLNRYFFSFS